MMLQCLADYLYQLSICPLLPYLAHLELATCRGAQCLVGQAVYQRTSRNETTLHDWCSHTSMSECFEEQRFTPGGALPSIPLRICPRCYAVGSGLYLRLISTSYDQPTNI